MITVVCGCCGLKILVPESVQGREGRCLNCGGVVLVPRNDLNPSRTSVEYEASDRVGDRYVILGFIGRGGMGVVYHAEDTLVKEEVALKFLRTDILRTEKGRRLFLQEAQIARRLRHENIIAVHDVGFTDTGVLFLSMEYARGQSLRDLLKRHRLEKRYIPPRLAVSIAMQVLEALDYAHRLVVHRDIKPENIMLLKNELVKVLDFGLAKAVEEEEVTVRPGQDKRKRRVVGTLAYASPEQIQHQPVDLRADIYAVGLVLRELLSLRTPVEMGPEQPIKREDVAPGILDAVKRAVMEDKQERWQSARAFRDALKQAFDESYLTRAPGVVHTRASDSPSTEGMALFHGGMFLMGNDTVREEAPEEEVYVAPFWMDIYPVTVAQYARYLKATGAQEPRFWRDPQCNGPDQPVVGISWDEALAYAGWAGKSLPTEAQWEFVARGQENRKYPWGHLAPDTTRCNYKNYLGMPSMVSMHEDGQTPEGIFDLAGNVHEWTLDPFAPYTQIRRQPDVLRETPRKTVRGGAFDSDIPEITTTARKGLFPTVREKNVGFRCVVAHEE